MSYRRDRFTWLAFIALLIFGVLNSVLGPALPYLRAQEDLSYLQASAYQVAFAVGGGLAGLLGTRHNRIAGRAAIMRIGLAGMGAAGIGIGFGSFYGVTVAAALLMSLFGTSALIRLWAALADQHGRWRAIAMTEGEVSVSMGGVLAPLLLAALAATVLGWSAAFAIVAIAVAVVVVALNPAHIPAQPRRPKPVPRPAAQGRARRLPATLVLAFSIVALEWCLSFWLASYLNDDVGLGREVAVAMAGVFYAAMLAGRLCASRLARTAASERLIGGSLLLICAGLPVLLAAHGPTAAGIGVAVLGVGLGPTFPLVSALHVGVLQARDGGAGSTTAVAQRLITGSGAQILGPLLVGVIAQAGGLRRGLIALTGFVVLGIIALVRHLRRAEA